MKSLLVSITCAYVAFFLTPNTVCAQTATASASAPSGPEHQTQTTPAGSATAAAHYGGSNSSSHANTTGSGNASANSPATASTAISNGQGNSATANANHNLNNNNSQVNTNTTGSSSSATAVQGSTYGGATNSGGTRYGPKGGKSDAPGNSMCTGSEACGGHAAALCTGATSTATYAGSSPHSAAPASSSSHPPAAPKVDSTAPQFIAQEETFKVTIMDYSYLDEDGIYKTCPVTLTIIISFNGETVERFSYGGFSAEEILVYIKNDLEDYGMTVTIVETNTLKITYKGSIGVAFTGGKAHKGQPCSAIIVSNDP